jgi:hypothetical protein
LISTNFGGYAIEVTYLNENNLNYGEYRIGEVEINGKKVSGKRNKKNSSMTLDNYKQLLNNSVNKIHITLN